MRRQQWWTWSADRPVAIEHLESGFRITPVVFSSRLDKASLLPAGPDLEFGSRARNGRGVAFFTRFGGTEIHWCYDFGADGGLAIQWKAKETAEWGLRYWVAIFIEAPEGTLLAHDPAGGKIDGGGLVVRSVAPPSLVTAHDDIAGVAAEFDDRGYFYLESRADQGQRLALRYNLEQAAEQRIEIELDGAAAPKTTEPKTDPATTAQAALQAVHDVVSWNHVFDAVNGRPYTVLSRFWNTRKFGGFGVWLADVLYHAMMWSWFDPVAARENCEAVFAWQTEAGNFPCLVTGNDAWLDRSQIPTASFTVWQIFLRSGDRAFLESAYPRLMRNHDWWRRCRSLGDTGFVTYGTTPGVGNGLYAGTKFGAQNESAMDNSPVHDAVAFDPASGLLQTIDVGLNSLYALDAEMLGFIANALGNDVAAETYRREHAKLADAISKELWDPSRAIFANRLPNGNFIDALAPTSFYPMAAGAASAEQTRQLHDGYIAAPDKFGGTFGVPSVCRDHPAFHDNVYWRGRVWPPMNFWTHLGLRRQGLTEEARALAKRGWKVFHQGWQNRHCGENFNADTGEISDQPDADGFYTWGALFAAMTAAEAVDVNPWHGLSVDPFLAGDGFGPVFVDGRALSVGVVTEQWEILIDGHAVLRGNVSSRLTDLVFTEESIELTLPPGRGGDYFMIPNHDHVSATAGDFYSVATNGRVELPPRLAPLHIILSFGPS